jgi:hypothetical protein
MALLSTPSPHAGEHNAGSTLADAHSELELAIHSVAACLGPLATA